MGCVNLVLLRILCKKSRCFPGKFTQLAKILHAGRDGRDESQLCLSLALTIHKIHSSCPDIFLISLPVTQTTFPVCEKISFCSTERTSFFKVKLLLTAGQQPGEGLFFNFAFTVSPS